MRQLEISISSNGFKQVSDLTTDVNSIAFIKSIILEFKRLDFLRIFNKNTTSVPP